VVVMVLLPARYCFTRLPNGSCSHAAMPAVTPPQW
jgi:hypothetical protein